MRQERQKKKGSGVKEKRESQACCVTFKPETFCFVHLPELCKLIFYIILHQAVKHMTCKQLCG